MTATTLTPKEYSQRTGMIYRTVMRHLEAGRVPGAFKNAAGKWEIPEVEVTSLHERARNLANVVRRFAAVTRWPLADAELRSRQAEVLAALKASTDEEHLAAFFLAVTCGLSGIALDDRLTQYADLRDSDGQTFYGTLVAILANPETAHRIAHVRVGIRWAEAEIGYRETTKGPATRAVRFVDPKHVQGIASTRVEVFVHGAVLHQLAIDARDAQMSGHLVEE